jgi:intraflagellar transport protein 81
VKVFQDTQEKLEEVSTMKGEMDEEKGKTLEEISKVVTEISLMIKVRLPPVQMMTLSQEQKAKLAPQIKELRAIRSQFQELETQYNEKKALYENAMMGIQR